MFDPDFCLFESFEIFKLLRNQLHIYNFILTKAKRRLLSVASVDGSSGQIVLAKPLDVESATVHEYTLVASDADGLSGEAILVIEVTDVNDEPPAFVPTTPSSLRVVVDGEATEQFVHKFDAVDSDTVSGLASGRRFEVR